MARKPYHRIKVGDVCNGNVVLERVGKLWRGHHTPIEMFWGAT